MAKPSEYDARTLTVPYRYDLGVGRDCGISYFVDNQLHQSLLGIYDGGSANHQGLGIDKADAGVGSEYSSDVLS